MKSVGIEFIANTRKALQAVDNLRNRITQSMDKIADSTSLKLFSGALFVDSIRRLKNAVSEVYDFGDFAKKYNLPINEVNKFAGAIEMLGGDSSDALSAIETLQKGIADLRTEGKGVLVELAQRTGLNIGALGKDFNTAFTEIRNAYRRLGEAGKIKFREKLGFTSPAMIKMLEASDVEYKKLLADAEKLSVDTQSVYNSLDKVRESLGKLKRSFKEATKSILTDLNPLINKFDELVKRFNELPQGTKKGILYGLFFAGLTPAMLKILPLLGSLLLSPTALFAGGAAVTYFGWDYLVKQFEDSWTQIFEVFDWVTEKWNGALKGLTTSWDLFVKQFEDVFTTIFEWIDKLMNFMGLSGKKEIKTATTPATISTPYTRSMMSESGTARNSWLNGLLMSGNTFNVNIVGSDNPFEMSRAFEDGVVNGLGGVGGFR